VPNFQDFWPRIKPKWRNLALKNQPGNPGQNVCVWGGVSYVYSISEATAEWPLVATNCLQCLYIPRDTDGITVYIRVYARCRSTAETAIAWTNRQTVERCVTVEAFRIW